MEDRLDRYQFYERDWEDYASLREWFTWDIPDQFNVTAATIDYWSANAPSDDAIVDVSGDGTTTVYTYGELDVLVSQCAAALASRGIETGDRVAVNAGQRVETLVGHLAAWKLGAVSVPLSVRFGPDALAYRLGDCEVLVGIVSGDRLPAFVEALRAGEATSVEHVLALDAPTKPRYDDVEISSFWSAVEHEPGTAETASTRAETDATIIYTSGTTGEPKGVRHAHRFLLGHLPTAVTGFFNMDPRPRERFYTPVEWAWVGPLWAFTMTALYYGKTAIAHRGRFNPERMFELVEDFGVTRLLGPATVWRRLQTVDRPAKRFDTHTVQVIMSAGESMGAHEYSWVQDVFQNAAIHEGYGQTEAMNLVMDCSALFPKRPSKMGKPTPGVEVRLVDPETGEPTVARGDVGEIAVRYDDGHPLCFKEYWHKPDRTAAKIHDGWLLTEDLAFVDDDGYLEFHSRKDDVIICSGYRISPEEVQESLSRHSAVADVGVIGFPDEERGEVPMAFIVLQDGIDGKEELKSDLQNHVKEDLAMYEYPRRIAFRDELPTTGSGKIDRTTLREQVE